MQVYGDLKKAQAEQLSSDSTANLSGQFWYNTTSNSLKYYNGAVREVVNLNEAQVMSNKSFSNQITLSEITTPSTPSANTVHLYARTDGIFYGKADDGVSTAVGHMVGSVHTVTALDVDWRQALVFYKLLSGSSTFTFSNSYSGQVISLMIYNNGGGTATITFPTHKKPTGLNLEVESGKYCVYTIINHSGTYLISGVEGLA